MDWIVTDGVLSVGDRRTNLCACNLHHSVVIGTADMPAQLHNHKQLETAHRDALKSYDAALAREIKEKTAAAMARVKAASAAARDAMAALVASREAIADTRNACDCPLKRIGVVDNCNNSVCKRECSATVIEPLPYQTHPSAVRAFLDRWDWQLATGWKGGQGGETPRACAVWSRVLRRCYLYVKHDNQIERVAVVAHVIATPPVFMNGGKIVVTAASAHDIAVYDTLTGARIASRRVTDGFVIIAWFEVRDDALTVHTVGIDTSTRWGTTKQTPSVDVALEDLLLKNTSGHLRSTKS